MTRAATRNTVRLAGEVVPQQVLNHPPKSYLTLSVAPEQRPEHSGALALRLERDPEIITESELRLMDGNR